MQAKALIRFNTSNFTANAGDIINFEKIEDAQHLLTMGWIELMQEGKAAAKK